MINCPRQNEYTEIRLSHSAKCLNIHRDEADITLIISVLSDSGDIWVHLDLNQETSTLYSASLTYMQNGLEPEGIEPSTATLFASGKNLIMGQDGFEPSTPTL